MFPASYKNAAIIAERGSWNRSTPSGPRVMVARTDGRRVTSYEPLLMLSGSGRRTDDLIWLRTASSRRQTRNASRLDANAKLGTCNLALALEEETTFLRKAVGKKGQLQG
ncbi:MAG TPA: hypothetical protein VGJ18_18850 [Gemmatimonadaceae bacterium]|jgi:hypothetical protein